MAYIELDTITRAWLIDRIRLEAYIELGSIARAWLIDRIRLGSIH